MSVDQDVALTPEEGLLLSFELEEMFPNRYTAEDKGFQEHLKTGNSGPPLVENWYTRPKRTFDYARSNQDDRGYGGDRYSNQGRYNRSGGYHDNRNRRSHDNRYRPYDRHHHHQHRDRNDGERTHDRARKDRADDRTFYAGSKNTKSYD